MQSRILLLMIMTIATGAVLPLQAGINARLGKVSGGAVVAAFISFLVGTVLLGSYILFSKKQGIQWNSLQSAPFWLFAGGIIGAFYVSISTYIIPLLGTALTFSLIIAGQLVAAMIIDHFGWLGMEIKPVSIGKIVGVILLMAGVVLIRKY